MATRRVLVFDDDDAFIALLQNSLGAYGFEVRAVGSELDNVQTAKVFNPEAIFIAVDAPEAVGYTLFNKARVTVGKKTRIILATATLPPEDFASHQKLKLHADLYLDKRGLSRDDLLQKLNGLIGLGPRIAPFPPENDDGFEEIGVFGCDGFDLLEVPDHEVYPAEPERPANQQVGVGVIPAPVSESLGEKEQGEGHADRAVSSEANLSGAQIVVRGGNGYNDLNRRLAEQQTELFHLRRQLEEARRDARSSPFSNDFLELRERVVQKDLEITLLTEKLHDTNSEIHAGKLSFEELNRTVIGLSAEIGQGLKREQELTDLLQEKEQEVSRLRDQHAAALEQAKHEKRSALESVRNLAEEERLAAEEAHRHALDTLNEGYAAQLAQVQAEKDAEIEALEQSATDEQQRTAEMLAREKQAHQQTADMLAREKQAHEQTADILAREKQAHEQTADKLTREQQAHQQTRQQSEFRIAQLRDQHAAAMKQAEREKYSAIESVRTHADEELTRVEEAHRHALQTLEAEYAAQLAQLQSEKDAEIETLEQKAVEEQQQTAEMLAREKQAHDKLVQEQLAHQQTAALLAQEKETHVQTRQQSEARIAQLQDEHAAAMKQAELEKRSALESVRKLGEEVLVKTEARYKRAIHTIDKNHAAELARLQSEKEVEIETREQETADQQQIADILEREKQAHQQTREQYESKIAQLQVVIRESAQERVDLLRAAKDKHEADLRRVEERHSRELLNLESAILSRGGVAHSEDG